MGGKAGQRMAKELGSGERKCQGQNEGMGGKKHGSMGVKLLSLKTFTSVAPRSYFNITCLSTVMCYQKLMSKTKWWCS